MVKVALLIGSSEYKDGLTSLPSAVKDVKAMQRVLESQEMGNFDEVKILTNPDLVTMRDEIQTVFAERKREDLILLFFSGHGLRDDTGKLYFATNDTSKSNFQSKSVAASFVHERMSDCSSKRQVVILDCCYSGAFAEGLKAKDDGSIDIKRQLGGEGRAILTSSTAVQYSFEQKGSNLSVYTRYLVEGIETGAADSNQDSMVSVDELHEYAKRKVREAAPAMKPEIYAIKEGYKIRLAKAKLNDPKLIYRRAVEFWVRNNNGVIPEIIGRTDLEEQRNNLDISSEETVLIEQEVLAPYQEYERKLQRYNQAYFKALRRGYSPERIRKDLKQLQQTLQLRDEDISSIPSINDPFFYGYLTNWLLYIGAFFILLILGFVGIKVISDPTFILLLKPVENLTKEDCESLNSEYQQKNKKVREKVKERDGDYRRKCNEYDVLIPED